MLGFRQMLRNFIVVVSNVFFLILVIIGAVEEGTMKRKKEGHIGH